MDEVERVDGWVFPRVLKYPFGFVDVVVHASVGARQYLLADILLEVSEQILGFLRTVAPLRNSLENDAVNRFHITTNG